MQRTKVGIIGLGNMGGAIANGLAAFEDIKISGYDPDRAKILGLPGISEAIDCASLTRENEYIILAIKPNLMAQVVREITPTLGEDKCLVSIAAGVRAENISKYCASACPVIRVMPNTPALVKKGVFAVCLDDARLTNEQKNFALGLFERLGSTHVLAENYFDAFTALIGSGPAYVYYFLESLIDAGVTMGLPRKEASNMVTSLFSGSTAMLEEQGKHPTLLKEAVTSPGGTTIAGLNEMEKNGVKSAIIRAALKARDRCRELGKE